MARAPPLQVLGMNAAHALRVGRREAEGGGEDDVSAVVEDGVVVAEPEIGGVHGPSLPVAVRISAPG